jgi:hypothetical protein
MKLELPLIEELAEFICQKYQLEKGERMFSDIMFRIETKIHHKSWKALNDHNTKSRKKLKLRYYPFFDKVANSVLWSKYYQYVQTINVLRTNGKKDMIKLIKKNRIYMHLKDLAEENIISYEF